jgi:hypothetical protein
MKSKGPAKPVLSITSSTRDGKLESGSEVNSDNKFVFSERMREVRLRSSPFRKRPPLKSFFERSLRGLGVFDQRIFRRVEGEQRGHLYNTSSFAR